MQIVSKQLHINKQEYNSVKMHVIKHFILYVGQVAFSLKSNKNFSCAKF